MPAQVGAMTMSELRLVLEGVSERARREHERDVALAWHVASLERTKRIPSLKRLLDRRRRVTAGEAESQREELAEVEEAVLG